jgi:catechol 2,3-dioxygenase-like lactoylglutathione lyase family enzyme
MHKLLPPFVCLAFAAVALAQLPPPNDAGVAMGHLHITTKDSAAQMKFWVDLMGGTRARIGPLEVVKFPGVIVFFTKGSPSGGTKGSVINHLGFQVPDVPSWVAKAKAAGGNIVTAAEVPQAKADFWFNPAVKTHQAFIMGPDEVKIEISEVPSLKEPIAHHHVHFYTVSDLDSKAWYAKMFSGIPGKRGPFECVDVPGVNLSFSKGEPTLAPTKGRSLDHIGFEIKNLEAFCKKLESMGVKFDVPYKKVPAINSSIAFFTDPWGVYVELTEGLNKI